MVFQTGCSQDLLQKTPKEPGSVQTSDVVSFPKTPPLPDVPKVVTVADFEAVGEKIMNNLGEHLKVKISKN